MAPYTTPYHPMLCISHHIISYHTISCFMSTSTIAERHGQDIHVCVCDVTYLAASRASSRMREGTPSLGERKRERQKKTKEDNEACEV